MSYENLTAANVKQAMSAVGAGRSDMFNVPLAQIKVMAGFNVRTRNKALADHIAYIGESILANGFDKSHALSGYVAKEGGESVIYVTDGHNRLEAVAYANERGAGIETLPVITAPAGTSIEDLTVALVTGNSGKALTPMEKAVVVKRLAGYGMEVPVIAKRLGVTAGYIKDLLLLIGAPKKIRDAVDAGKISAANAVAMMKREGDGAVEALEEALEAAEEAGEEKVSKKTLRKPAAPKRDLLAEGIEWISNRDERNVKGFVEMLAFITGETVESINEALQGE